MPENEALMSNNLSDTYLEERYQTENNASCDGPHTPHLQDQLSSFQNETRRYTYPPHLRHHEPLAFLQTGFCCPILNKFTFNSRQSFHRPPIHYSKDELLTFIKQGFFSKQDPYLLVDEVDLKIDLLNFTLDR